jgi:hypothetical protein
VLIAAVASRGSSVRGGRGARVEVTSGNEKVASPMSSPARRVSLRGSPHAPAHERRAGRNVNIGTRLPGRAV